MGIKTSNGNVPARINQIISEKGLKKHAVAEWAGIKKQAFSEMLTGRRIIKAKDIIGISIALKVTPNDLFEMGDLNVNKRSIRSQQGNDNG